MFANIKLLSNFEEFFLNSSRVIVSKMIIVYLFVLMISSSLGQEEGPTITSTPEGECRESIGIWNRDKIKESQIEVFHNEMYMHKIKTNVNFIRLNEEAPVYLRTLSSQVRIQVDLGEMYNLTGMVYRGRSKDLSRKYELFSLQHSADNKTYKYLYNSSLLFPVNTDMKNVTHDFPYTIQARYLKIIVSLPKEAPVHFNFVLQFELLGCNISYPTSSTPVTTKTSTEFTTETTVTPCNDLLNVTSTIEELKETIDDDKKENRKFFMKINFKESGVYEVTTIIIRGECTKSMCEELLFINSEPKKALVDNDQYIYKFTQRKKTDIIFDVNKQNVEYITIIVVSLKFGQRICLDKMQVLIYGCLKEEAETELPIVEKSILLSKYHRPIQP